MDNINRVKRAVMFTSIVSGSNGFVSLDYFLEKFELYFGNVDIDTIINPNGQYDNLYSVEKEMFDKFGSVHPNFELISNFIYSTGSINNFIYENIPNDEFEYTGLHHSLLRHINSRLEEEGEFLNKKVTMKINFNIIDGL